MTINRELFLANKRQKMTVNAFFSYVAQITNRNVMPIFLTDNRFTESVIDANKVYLLRLKLKYKKKKIFKIKTRCPITGRQRANIRFFGHISRFQLKEMVCEGQFLVGVSRFGW